MAEVFLSYASEDVERARSVAAAIKEAGFSVWWAPDLQSGSRYRDVILQQLNEAKCVVVLWSAASVESSWVIDEADHGRDRLVPVRIEDVQPPLGFRSIHTATVLDDADDLPADVLAAIGEKVKRKPPPPRPRRRVRIPWLVIGVVLALALIAAWVVSRPKQKADAPAVSTSTTAAPDPRLLQPLEERETAIRLHVAELGTIAKPRLPDRFYGPINRPRIEQEIEDRQDDANSLLMRREECRRAPDEQKMTQCVEKALAEFPPPKALPPHGYVYPVEAKRYATDPSIDLHRAVPTVLLERDNHFTRPVTVFVKGEWSGLAPPDCADVIVATMEFSGAGRTFNIYAENPKGRRIAREITGRPLPPTKRNHTGVAQQLGHDDLAVMEGWPIKTALSVTFKGAETYGKNSTACRADLPYVVIWQPDDRINSADPYDVERLLN